MHVAMLLAEPHAGSEMVEGVIFPARIQCDEG